MAYNPYKEVNTINDTSLLPFLIIERQPHEAGEDWQYHRRLIENVLRHFDEVVDCTVDTYRQAVYVDLENDEHVIRNLETIAHELRWAIGKVACFDYTSQSSS